MILRNIIIIVLGFQIRVNITRLLVPSLFTFLLPVIIRKKQEPETTVDKAGDIAQFFYIILP